MEIEGKTLKLTNLNKVFYPEQSYTKRDVLNYYDAVAELILPHLKDRPLSLKRYPDGIHGEYFFQKNVPRERARWLRTVPIYHEETEGATNYAFGWTLINYGVAPLVLLALGGIVWLKVKGVRAPAAA